MSVEKDIRFTDKKVDESWKEQTQKERSVHEPQPRPAAPQQTPAPAPEQQQPSKKTASNKEAVKSSPIFTSFLNSLAYQVLMHLGEIPFPGTDKTETNLDQAKELIDILLAIKDKVRGNTGPEEEAFFESVLPELQMKYVNQS